MFRIDAVVAGQVERPRALGRFRDAGDVERGNGVRRQCLILENIVVGNPFCRDERLAGSVRQRFEFGLAGDPDIAEAVRQRNMDQGNVGDDRRQGNDAVGVRKRVLDHTVVFAAGQDVGPYEAAQRHEGNTLLAGLQSCVNCRTSRILDSDGTRFDCAGETRRRTEFAHGDTGGFHRRDTPRANKQIRGKTSRWDRDQMETTGSAADEGPDGLHRYAGILEDHQSAAIRNFGGNGVGVGQNSGFGHH